MITEGNPWDPDFVFQGSDSTGDLSRGTLACELWPYPCSWRRVNIPWALDFGGLTTSRFSTSKGGIPRPIGSFPEVQSQRFLVCGFSVRGLTANIPRGLALAAPFVHGELAGDAQRVAELDISYRIIHTLVCVGGEGFIGESKP